MPDTKLELIDATTKAYVIVCDRDGTVAVHGNVEKAALADHLRLLAESLDPKGTTGA